MTAPEEGGLVGIVPTSWRARVNARPLSKAATLAAALALMSAVIGAKLVSKSDALRLPAIVFVQRTRPAGAQVTPGVGPSGRTEVTHGRLAVREGDGRLRLLVPENAFFDVSGPAVSYDGRRVVFAAVVARDSAWRLWRCDANGRDLAPVTAGLPAVDATPAYGAMAQRFLRADDFDPCWLPDGRIVFASTRWPLLSQQGSIRASNLFVVNADGSGLRRLTAERNGGEAPSVDPATGRIVYARWFFNRFRAADTPAGVVAGFAGALPADTVDLWQAGAIDPDGSNLKLAGGDPRSRTGEEAYQPVLLADGTLLGVRGLPANLARSPRLGIQSFAKGFASARPLAGLGAGHGWSACSPCPLPDGRILFTMDEDGTGNYDLFVSDLSGRNLQPLGSEPATLELDPAVLAPRALPPVPQPGMGWPLPPDELPHTTLDAVRDDGRTARFDCLNVFANAGVDSVWPDAVPLQRGVRIRFFTALPRPGREGNDSLVLVQEAEVSPQGAVHVDAVPADVPLFEQLVDATGRVLRSALSPAHVPGFSALAQGAGTKCVGCHTGHSAIPVAESEGLAQWTNVSPSARVTASSAAGEGPGARAAVDRRARGATEDVAWIAAGGTNEWLKLEWPLAIDAKAAILYAAGAHAKAGGPLRVKRAELVFRLAGREVGRVPIERELSPAGTRIEFPQLKLDALEFRPLVVEGRWRGRPAAALAEIETMGRIAWE